MRKTSSFCLLLLALCLTASVALATPEPAAVAPSPVLVASLDFLGTASNSFPLSAGPSESSHCYNCWQEGECFFCYDACSGWCTASCPWGDSQGPC